MLRRELLDQKDIAELYAVQYGTVRMWRWQRRGILPEPDVIKGGVPLWLRATLIEAMAKQGRHPVKED